MTDERLSSVRVMAATERYGWMDGGTIILLLESAKCTCKVLNSAYTSFKDSSVAGYDVSTLHK